MICICYNFYEYSGSYTYTITTYRFKTADLYTYFYFVYSVRSYHKTYYTPIKPISIKDLVLDLDLYLLKLCKLYRRLKTKRVRKTV